MTQVKNDHATEGTGLENGPFVTGFYSQGDGLTSLSSTQIPPRLYNWSRTALLTFLLLTVTVVFVPWTQTVTVQGQLSSFYPQDRPQEIHSQIKGRIKKWSINEGSLVKQGDLILELGDIDPKFLSQDIVSRLDQSLQALREEKEAALRQAEILQERMEKMKDLAAAAIASAQARILEAENKVLTIQQKLGPAEGALETARLNLDRSRELETKGLLSRRELELAIQKMKETEAEVIAAQTTLQEAQGARLALVHEREQVEAELTQNLLKIKSDQAKAYSDAAKASKEIAEQEIERSNVSERLRSGRVVAPFAGRIVRLAKLGQGEVVNVGDLLLTLVPGQAAPAVEMWVKPIDTPLLRPGLNVRLMFQGVPAIPLPAWPELMSGTYDGRIQVVDQNVSTNGKFRLWVSPDEARKKWPPQLQVRQGTQVMGWVLLNRVPLWYELWRRFNLFPPDYNFETQSLKDVLLPKAGRPRK